MTSENTQHKTNMDTKTLTKEVTLRQAAEMLAEEGIKIKWANGCDLQDFFSYFDRHYKPLLEKLQEEWSGKPGAIRFLADDILTIFAE